MLIAIYVLLMLGVGHCTDDQIFETMAVGVGDDVTLTCNRQGYLAPTTFFWIRLVSGNVPEVLGGTFAYGYDGVNKIPRITAKQEPGTFILRIDKTQLSDTGAYYCMKVNRLDLTFLNGTFLSVKGPEPNITTVIQNFTSDPLSPGDSVTLQCSVLTHPENKTCPEENHVYWFRAGSDESHPSLIYALGNKSNGCEKSPEAGSPQKCVYSFSKNVSPSDAGTYYCAVASCGEIFYGNGAKLEIEGDTWNLQKANIVLFLLSAALVISLIVILFLIYTIKKKTYEFWNAAATASRDQQSQQRDEHSLVYSAPTFTKRKTGRAERRNVKTAEGETIYSDVRTSVIDQQSAGSGN